MMQNPRIYVAGKMDWIDSEDSKWTCVLSKQLREEIKTEDTTLLYPDDTFFDHGGDSPQGVAKADIELLDTCNGIISIFSTGSQPGTMVETLHAINRRKLALIIFADKPEGYPEGEPEKDEYNHPAWWRDETEYWFLLNYIHEYNNSMINKNLITTVRCAPKRVPYHIKKWLQQFEARTDLILQFNAKISSIEMRCKERKYPPIEPHILQLWERLTDKVENNFNCEYCGEPLKIIDHAEKHNKSFTFDHKKPLSEGGGNESENIAIVCHECNIIKGTMDHQTYLDFLEKTKDDPELRRRMFDQMWKGRKAARFYRQ